MKVKRYTISVFSENHVGLLQRVTGIFTRRHINIESITISASEIPGVHRFTMVVNLTEERVKKVVLQIEKQVEVLKAFSHTDEETVYQEIALYKVPTKAINKGIRLEQIVRDHQARILAIEGDFMIIEKTGHQKDTQLLLEQLKDYGVLEFCRSGRVAISKPMKRLSDYLTEMGAMPELVDN